jgi:Flp pilus assembly protein TadG
MAMGHRGARRAAFRARSQRGAAALEFALVLPIFVVLIFGVVSVGLTYSDHLAITNAAREGARFGAATDVTQSSWATSVQSRVLQTYNNFGSSSPTTSQICVQLIDSSGAVLVATPAGSSCGTAPSTPAGMIAGTCAVEVWVRKPAKISTVIFPSINFNIGASSVAYYGLTVTSGTPSCKSGPSV